MFAYLASFIWPPEDLTAEGNAQSDLSEIIPGKLYLSSRFTPQQFNVLQACTITHILSVTKVPLEKRSTSLTYKLIELDDLSTVRLIEHFADAHNFIEDAWQSAGACLVHCDAGVSRSSTVVISFVMKHMNLNFKDAFLFVKEARSIIYPNSGFIHQLFDYEKKLFPDIDPNASRVFYLKYRFALKEGVFTDEEIARVIEYNKGKIDLALHHLIEIRKESIFLPPGENRY